MIDSPDVDAVGPPQPTMAKVYAWLSEPLRASWCLIGWMVATIVFVGLADVMGGPTQDDVSVSAYSTWAAANGHWACFYSPLSTHYFPPIASPYTMIAPLYGLISGVVLAITHSVGAVAFPTNSQLGPGCSHALVAMLQWSEQSNVIGHTIEVGYLMWLPLMVGAIVLLRTTGRGRTRWEPFTLLALAVLPPVLECLVTYFHPQDLLAIGLALCSLTLALRQKWMWSGALLGLAFTSNPFVSLVAAVLIVVVPNKERLRFILGGVVAYVVIVAPLAVLTSGRALRWSVIGSGSAPPPSGAGGTTWMRELSINPHVLLTFARILPVIGALALALWVKKRLGDTILEAVPLLSLVATSLALRLVFEVSVWGYYFAACAVLIVLNDVVQGRIRGHVIAWLALFTLVYNPVPWGFATNGRSWGLGVREAMPNVFIIGALALIVIDVLRHHVRWYIVTWFVLVCLTLVKNPFSHEALRPALPNWFWQIVIVSITIALAAGPLLKELRAGKSDDPVSSGSSASANIELANPQS